VSAPGWAFSDWDAHAELTKVFVILLCVASVYLPAWVHAEWPRARTPSEPAYENYHRAAHIARRMYLLKVVLARHGRPSDYRQRRAP